MSKGTVILSGGLLVKIHNYLKNLQLTNSQNHTLELLFNILGTFTSGNNGFKADVMPNDLTKALCDGTTESDELIKYYQSVLFDLLDPQNKSDFFEWFKILQEGIALYHNQFYIEELNNFFAAKKGKMKKNTAAQNNSCAAAIQLSNYINDIIKTGKYRPCDRGTFACSLFSCLYYLEHGYLPSKYSEQINGVYKDRQEFLNEIMMKYGCSGTPAKHQIYKLANRDKPNSIALFEAAELEYYGKGFDSSPNLQKAYDYYVKAVEAPDYNALAGWALGYMLYNYTNEKDSLYTAKVHELENMSFEVRVIHATEILKKSFDCGCPAAANVLGKILTDSKVDNSIKNSLTELHHLYSGYEYFKIASDAGYTFAKNNLYAYHIKKSTSAGDDEFNKAYNYLKESADLGEPYSMNKYAKCYLIEYMQDRKSALKYFVEASSLSEEWAAFNILKYYCTDNEGLSMIKNLQIINNDQSKFNAYISNLHCICTKSKKADIKESYKELAKENVLCT